MRKYKIIPPHSVNFMFYAVYNGSSLKNGSCTIKLYLSFMYAHYIYRVNYNFLHLRAVQTASC